MKRTSFLREFASKRTELRVAAAFVFGVSTRSMAEADEAKVKLYCTDAGWSR